MLKPLACLILALAVIAAPVSAKDKKQARKEAPEAFRQLVACRQIADSAARLACYDRQVAAFEQAESAGEVVLADRKQVEETQRGLFGFAIPGSAILGNENGKELTQVETVVTSARQYEYGRWRITMENGSVWDQIDAEVLAFAPRAGDKAVIKKAAFGSYLVRVAGQPGIKVRQIQ